MVWNVSSEINSAIQKMKEENLKWRAMYEDMHISVMCEILRRRLPADSVSGIGFCNSFERRFTMRKILFRPAQTGYLLNDEGLFEERTWLLKYILWNKDVITASLCDNHAVSNVFRPGEAKHLARKNKK